MADYFKGLRLSDQSSEVIDTVAYSENNYKVITHDANRRNGMYARADFRVKRRELHTTSMPLPRFQRIMGAAAQLVLNHENSLAKPHVDEYIADLNAGLFMEAVEADIQDRPFISMAAVFSTARGRLKERHSLDDGLDAQVLDHGLPGTARTIMDNALTEAYIADLYGEYPTIQPLRKSEMPLAEAIYE